MFTDTVEVLPLPTAAFSYVATGLSVSFTNASSDATSYLWDFGDGITSTLVNPTHVYALAGDYTVTLYAYSDCGMDMEVITITVTDIAFTFVPVVFKN